MREFIEVLRHQQPFVAEMAMSILQENEIPCFMQEGAVTGLEMSPVAPAAAPGVEYVVYVHKTRFKQAREIVDELPIDKVPWSRIVLTV